jgi:hypothetical protein
MKKKIIFILDSNSLEFFNEPIYCTYFSTEEAIKRKENPVITSDLSHLSFDLEDLGYEIYICYDGKLTHFYTGMATANGKELRKAHNLIRLFLGGALDDDLGISRKSFDNEECVDLDLLLEKY